MTGQRVDRRGVLAAILLAAGYFTIGWVRYVRLHAGASDLGIFDQASWLLSRGHAPFVTSIGINVFADHVSPVLLLFAPAYRLAPSPSWLLAAQAACLGATVVPLRALALEEGAPPWLATAATCASAPLLAAATYDFHPVVLATPAVACLLLAVRRDDRRLATVAALVIVLCRADAALAVAGAAILAAPGLRRRLLLMVPLPLAAAAVVPARLGTWQTFDHYYGKLGATAGQALLHPWHVLRVAPTAGLQLGIWLLPVGFVALLRWRHAVALVVAGLPLLLSSWPGIPSPWYHHGALEAPFVIAAALAVVGASAGQARRRAFFLGAMGAGVVTAALVASPLAPAAPGEVRLAAALARPRPAVVAAVAAVGPREGVSAANSILGQLSRRKDAFIYPCPFPQSDGRRCGHPDLAARIPQLDVVVLVGEDRDVSGLAPFGFTVVQRRDGITLVRRPPRHAPAATRT